MSSASDQPVLNEHEARVFGVLIEKSLTTPDHYPLSLNGATVSSNQKSNRDPVVDYLEAEVDVALQGLVIKGFAGRITGSRVEKFRHNGRERLDLGDGELAVLAELLMRGAQTPGQLRGRAHRMSPIQTLQDLEAHVAALLEKGFVQRLGPAPGSRAGRYGQTLAPGAHADEAAAAAPPLDPASQRPAPAPVAPAVAGGLSARVEALEHEVRELRRVVDGLCTELGASGDRAES